MRYVFLPVRPKFFESTWPYDLDDARNFYDYTLNLAPPSAVFAIKSSSEENLLGVIGYEGSTNQALGYWLEEAIPQLFVARRAIPMPPVAAALWDAYRSSDAYLCNANFSLVEVWLILERAFTLSPLLSLREPRNDRHVRRHDIL
jgi:hypothetical protein